MQSAPSSQLTASRLRARVAGLVQEQNRQLEALDAFVSAKSPLSAAKHAHRMLGRDEPSELGAPDESVLPSAASLGWLPSSSAANRLEELREGQRQQAGLVQQFAQLVPQRLAELGSGEASSSHRVTEQLIGDVMSVLTTNHAASQRLLDALRASPDGTDHSEPLPFVEQRLQALEANSSRATASSNEALDEAFKTIKSCEAAIAMLVDENARLSREAEQLRDNQPHADCLSDVESAYAALEEARRTQDDLKQSLRREKQRSDTLEAKLQATQNELSESLDRCDNLQSGRMHSSSSANCAELTELSALRTSNRAQKDEIARLRRELKETRIQSEALQGRHESQHKIDRLELAAGPHTPSSPSAAHCSIQKARSKASVSRPLPDGGIALHPPKLTPSRAADDGEVGHNETLSRGSSADQVLANAESILADVRTRATLREQRHRESVSRLKQRRAELQAAIQESTRSPRRDGPNVSSPGDSSRRTGEHGLHVVVEELRGQLEKLDREEAELHRQQNDIFQKRAAVSSTLMAQRNQKLMNGAPDSDVEALNNQISAVMSKIDAATSYVDNNLSRVHAKRDLLARQLRSAEHQLV